MIHRLPITLIGALIASAPLAAQSVTGVGSAGNRGPASAAPRVRRAELAGNSLPAYPWFEYVRAFHEGATVEVAVDPGRFPELVGRTCEVWLVASRDEAGWAADGTLVDARGAPQTETIVPGSIQGDSFLVDAGTLSGDAGTDLGVGYDVVIDADRDGVLSPGDVIDGLGLEAGLYVVRDTTLPGPLPVTETLYSGGTYLGQNTFYPTGIAGMGQLPLVVVSHGNGHNYQWYDHIGFHLASYGYVVMSHENNTGPGIETASTTTLTNTDYFLANLSTIEGGVLDGHIDSHHITWIGHSRGGEGVVRAYTRVYTGAYFPAHFTRDDIVLVSSISPVTFLSEAESNPSEVTYFFMYGAADSDVTGSPASGTSHPFALFERARGDRQLVYLQGVGHAWFHNGGGSCWCTGPALLNQAITHEVELGYYLPLVEHYISGNVPSLDFFQRPYYDFHPAGADPAVVATTEYRQALATDDAVIDDYQGQPSNDVSSSGGAVSYTVSALAEGQLRDQDGSFVYSAAVPMNGMTRAQGNFDNSRGVVFEWDSSSYYELGVVPALRDFSQRAFLSFRACQGSRHPNTDAWNAPLTFTVTLRDGAGHTSSIDVGNYARVTRTYPRTGSGSGAGWANEFTTVRLRLTDFLTDGSGLDLTDVEAVRFEFGSGAGSDEGRLGLDDVELTRS